MHKLVADLQASMPFQAWQHDHKEAFLSYFFGKLLPDGQLKEAWQVGYFDREKGVTLFSFANGVWETTPSGQPISGESLVPLNVEQLTLSYEEALQAALEKRASLYPQEQFGEGFVMITNQGWRFTFIARSLQFLQILVGHDSVVSSHQLVDLVQRE